MRWVLESTPANHDELTHGRGVYVVDALELDAWAHTLYQVHSLRAGREALDAKRLERRKLGAQVVPLDSGPHLEDLAREALVGVRPTLERS